MIIGPISLIFCGHLGTAVKLDGAALAISVSAVEIYATSTCDVTATKGMCIFLFFKLINATCIAVGQGLGTACDTFFSQTFGSSNKKLVGVYMQKGKLLLFNTFRAA